MINPKEFLRIKLTNIVEQVKSINVRYKYSEADDTHMVEVTPLSEYEDNETYLALERDLLFEFNDKFFPSTILFLSELSLNEILEPEFEFKNSETSLPFKSPNNKPNFTWNSLIHDSLCACMENNYALAA